MISDVQIERKEETMTDPTLVGIAASLDVLLGAQANNGPINPAGYTLKDAHAYANKNGFSIQATPDLAQILFIRTGAFGPQVIQTVPLLD